MTNQTELPETMVDDQTDTITRDQEELKKRRQYDKALKSLETEVATCYMNLQNADKTVAQCKDDLKDAKEICDNANKDYIKVSQKLCQMVKSDLANYQQSLLDYNYDDEDDKKIDVAIMSETIHWRNLDAADHFQLTDKEWENLENAANATSLTVGDIADVVDSLERGTKHAGLGPAKLEKLKTQFEKFWASNTYQRIKNGEQPAEADEQSADKSDTKPVHESLFPREVEPVVPDNGHAKIDDDEPSLYEQYIEILEEMLEEEDYNFAYDTLAGILEWIQENQHVTENQMKTIENIRKSVEER